MLSILINFSPLDIPSLTYMRCSVHPKMEQTKTTKCYTLPSSKDFVPSRNMLNIEDAIRKAKAEGRTVSLKENCLFIDYQLVEQLSPADLDYLYIVLGE